MVPKQDLAKSASALSVDELLGVGKLEVHVAVGGDEGAGVLGVAPLETDADVLADAAKDVSDALERGCAGEAARSVVTYRARSMGRGLTGMKP